MEGESLLPGGLDRLFFQKPLHHPGSHLENNMGMLIIS